MNISSHPDPRINYHDAWGVRCACAQASMRSGEELSFYVRIYVPSPSYYAYAPVHIGRHVQTRASQSMSTHSSSGTKCYNCTQIYALKKQQHRVT